MKQDSEIDISLTRSNICLIKNREWSFFKKYIFNNIKNINFKTLSLEDKIYITFKVTHKILILKQFHFLSNEAKYLLSYISLYYLALIKKKKKNIPIDIKTIYRNFINNYNKDVVDIVSFKSLILKNYTHALNKNEITEIQYNIFVQDFLNISHSISCRERISKKSLQEIEEILK